MTLSSLTPSAWLGLLIAAVLIGFAKTAVGGAASLSVVIFAAVLPARESTGALLPLLICGDLIALHHYRRHAHWPALFRLLPWVIPGLVVGTWFLDVVDDDVLRRTIGVTLLALCGIQLWSRRPRRVAPEIVAGTLRSGRRSTALAAVVGASAGFATMTANAAGPIMTFYLILAGLPVLELLGTGAWFFFAVNLAKLPFSAGLGLMSADSLVVDASLLPGLAVGAALGVWTIRHISRDQFERAALALGGVAAALLLL